MHHVGVDDVRKIGQLQGSKYVQSSIGAAYQQAKKQLAQGRKVLFSGTPCQIDGLYGFLGKENDDLITVDLVCHGVPNQRMFMDYLHSLGDVGRFSFRDKSLGWGINGKYLLKGEKKPNNIWQSGSPYLYYFTKGMIYRDSCYVCKYACKHRPADITLGDFWGIEKQHPEYLKDNNFNARNGISVVIGNTEKGVKLLESCSSLLNTGRSEFSKAAAGNTQLVRPSAIPQQRKEILDLYAQHGWQAVAERFVKNIGFRRYSSKIKSMIPYRLKELLKRVGK